MQPERLLRLAREGGWIFLGQVMVVAGALFGVRVLSELLSATAYGELSLGMTLATLVNQIILGPLAGGAIRFYAPAFESGSPNGYLKSLKRLLFLANGIVVGICILSVTVLLLLGEAQWIPITLAAFALAIITGYGSSLSGIQTASRQRSVVALHQGAEAVLRIGVAAGLLLWLGSTSTLALTAYAVTALLILASQYYFFQKKTAVRAHDEVDRDWQREIFNFSWPIGIFGIFTWMQLASDRWALQFFSSTEDVGSYAILYQLGYYPISILSSMMMTLFIPILYHRAGDASDANRMSDVHLLSWRLTWLSIGLTLLGAVIALFAHELLFSIFVASKYEAVSYLLPWVILAGGVFASGQTLASNMLARMKSREMLAVKIVTALVGVLLNFVAAYLYGLPGVVVAGVLFSIFYFVWMAALVTTHKRMAGGEV